MENCIHIKGARQHNLKGLEIRFPRNQLSVVTGVSGSGKSSLAFDTLYAEGYRRFIDSLSPRARQMLEQLPRPDVDFIHGLSPVLAVEQQESAGSNPRSTVATVTEIADYARLLWAVEGIPYCPKDNGRIVQRSLDDCLARILSEAEGSRIQLLAPYMEAKAAVIRGELPHLRLKGFQRIRIDGNIVELDDPDAVPSGRDMLVVEIVIDRLVLRADQRSRLADSLELAFREGGDRAIIWLQESGSSEQREFTVSQHFSCEKCGEVYPRLISRSFSHDHPAGACPECGGLGQTLQFVESLVVPDKSKTVKGGAIKTWRLGSKRMIIQRNAILKQLAEQYPFDPTTAWSELDEEVRHAILHGVAGRTFLFKTKPGNRKPEEVVFEGVLADLENTRRETSSDSLRHRLMAYQIRQPCQVCGCERLNALSRNVKLAGVRFPEFMRWPLAKALAFVEQLKLDTTGEAVDGIRQRLMFLNEVGLGYLTLDRPYSGLSGGESQRVRLATHLGMGLVGVTYVLDEPTIGLHPADTGKLLHTLKDLRDRGNTVVVVEHDPDIIEAADYLVEIGPGAGNAGGQLMFNGTIAEAKADPRCQAGRYLSGLEQVEHPGAVVAPGGNWLVVEGAVENNLKNIDARVPQGCVTCVTGVSGSGKSTLVHEIIAKSAALRLNRAKVIPGRHRKLSGLEDFDRVVVVDQEPIGRSPRSNPATYVKLFDDLRALFAQTALAKVRGYKTSRFSFNMRGGRCERCQGDGVIKLDMQFLSDVYSECPACQGKRYNRETLEVRFRGYNISDVLNMSVDEALAVFAHQPKIQRKLETLHEVGLGYIALGQASNTLSGGEAQRIKLSLEMSKGQRGQSLYILDEPTTGLHWQDIQHLLNLLFRLRDLGHTVLMIEHNLDVIRLADWVLDLGPGGGDAGGELIFAGTPQELARCKESLTGQAL